MNRYPQRSYTRPGADQRYQPPQSVRVQQQSAIEGLQQLDALKHLPPSQRIRQIDTLLETASGRTRDDLRGRLDKLRRRFR